MPQFVGCSKNSSKREIHSDKYLSQENFQINNLTLHLKKLEKQEQIKPKVNRRLEITKVKAEIDVMDNRKQ